MLNRSATGGLVERATVYIAGVAIMAAGIGVVGAINASIATWMTQVQHQKNSEE